MPTPVATHAYSLSHTQHCDMTLAATFHTCMPCTDSALVCNVLVAVLGGGGVKVGGYPKAQKNNITMRFELEPRLGRRVYMCHMNWANIRCDYCCCCYCCWCAAPQGPCAAAAAAGQAAGPQADRQQHVRLPGFQQQQVGEMGGMHRSTGAAPTSQAILT